MDKHLQFEKELKDHLRANPDLSWQSESSTGPNIEVVTYQAETIKTWRNRGFEQPNGKAEELLSYQKEADPSEAMSRFVDLFLRQATRVSYFKPSKSEDEKLLYILAYFKDYYTGCKIKLIET